MNNLIIIESKSFNPIENLSLEMTLFELMGPKDKILYLWQNEPTVVIGHNQNVYKECFIENIREDKVHLVRRYSGGGSVYHDLGNLNFTFLMNKEDFSINNQNQIILNGLKKLNINGLISGRNDLIINNRKFSGNAYYYHQDKAYHHGTLLIDVELDKMKRYLNTSIDKLKMKGVDSVSQRVINLKEINNDLKIDIIKEKIIEAFKERYDNQIGNIIIDNNKLNGWKEKLGSDKWIYGNNDKYEKIYEKRFIWGELWIGIKLEDNLIRKCKIYSDSLDIEGIGILEESLNGCILKKEEIIKRIEILDISMKDDVINWVKGWDLI